MEQSDLLAYLVEVFDRLNLGYFIAGSIATSYYGEPRFTNDIDVVVELTASTVSTFCRSFPSEDFYVSFEAARSAVRERRQFNILYPATGLKIDVFVLNDTAFEQSRFSRRQCLKLEEERTAWFATPEDAILKKLVYYEEGGSEKHIRDILSVLKVQENLIDFDYLADWASQLGLHNLWQDVLAQIKPDTTDDEDAS
jgi:hypothetical protein